MIQKLTEHDRENLQESLATSGQKVTPQREIVFAVLLAKRDHPTVEDVFQRARESMPGLSLATVYNCLETFVGCGLVRQVNHERESTRYCPNLAPHAHFRDEATGTSTTSNSPRRLSRASAPSYQLASTPRRSKSVSGDAPRKRPPAPLLTNFFLLPCLTLWSSRT
ncbi:peroxide-responsive repressor PerR [Verrucomicrobiota bacterium]|nr:peroxide-responsive repressor PerR [Verrucomicrobiota bacterium]